MLEMRRVIAAACTVSFLYMHTKNYNTIMSTNKYLCDVSNYLIVDLEYIDGP